METGRLSESSTELRTHPATNSSEDHLSPHGNKLSSHSSSFSASSSASGDQFELLTSEPVNSSTGTTRATHLDKDAHLSNHGKEDILDNSPPKNEGNSHSSLPPHLPDVPAHTYKSSSSSESITQSASVQVIEKEGDYATTPSYRIPSSVFSRTKSTNPVEWSACSNESLFSIHMGDASFNIDPLYLKSGELDKPGDPSSFSPLIDYPSIPASVNHATGLDKKSSSQGLGAEAADAQTIEVTIENKEIQNKEKLPVADNCHHSGSLHRNSDESGSSMKSFAFPILTGNSDKSRRQQSQSLLQLQTPKLNLHSQEQAETPKETPKAPAQQKPETPKEKPAAPARKGWLSRFSCCSFCS